MICSTKDPKIKFFAPEMTDLNGQLKPLPMTEFKYPFMSS